MMLLPKKLYSFDIFDTLVTRRVATPDGILALVQTKLRSIPNLPEFFQENFCTIRVETEQYTRYNKFSAFRTYEVSFDEIYNTIAQNYNLDSSIIEKIKRIELTLERENLVPIIKNIDKLKKSAEDGHIVLISDMYFGSSYLRELLESIHPLFQSIKIYSSADIGVSKSNGKLYEYVAKNENVEPRNWFHFGDSFDSDVVQAKRHGINAIWLKQEDFFEYEKFLLKNNRYNAKIQIAVGTARVSRINACCTSNPEKFGFGASFAGPILYNYVDWVIRQSLASKAQTLYFVARDGYILKKIADSIIESKGYLLKTKYIYGSRLVWRIPREKNYATFIEEIFDEYRKKLTVELLAYRLLIPEKKLREILQIPQHLSVIHRLYKKKLCRFIIESPAVKDFILSQFEKKHDMLVSYLKQEINLRDGNLFFVDLFGSGRTQDYLYNSLSEIVPNIRVNFFYITTIYCASNSDTSRKFSYLNSVKYAHYWIELLARCEDGQTVSYESDESKIRPVVEKINKIPMKNWGFESYLHGVLSYAKNVCTTESINKLTSSTIQHYILLFDYVRSYLDKNTADILGSMPYKDVGCELEQTEAAPKISIFFIILNFILCKKPESVSLFPCISYKRNSMKCDSLFLFLKKFPTLQKFVIDIHYHKRDRKLLFTLFGITMDMSRILKKG